MTYYTTIIILIIFWINFVIPSKILIWSPTPSVSHQILYYPIVKELSKRGHQVTFMTPDPLNDINLVNLTEIDLHYSYDIWNHVKIKWGDSGIFQYKIMNLFFPAFAKVLDLQLKNELVQKAFFENNYNLFIVEANWYPALSLLKPFLKCPVIALTTLPPGRIGYQLVGDLVNPAYEGYYLLDFNKPRNFMQKIINNYMILYDYFKWNYYFIPNQIDVLKKYFKNKIQYDTNLIKVDMILSNSHPILTGVRNNFPTVIEIGGINNPKKRGLPKDLKEFLDSSDRGAIYISFGSNVKSNMLPINIKQTIIETIKKLPYKVLWKYEDELNDKPENLFTYKWVPQIDVLNHPNIKLFVTQGGLQSLEETIHAKVPIVGIPFSGDQFWNVDHMVNNLHMGVHIDYRTITIDTFYRKILNVLNDTSFKENIIEINKLFLDAPINPLEKAIYWIEYVIRHKSTKHLESPKFNMKIYEYLLLDIILFSFVFLILSMFILYIIVVKIFAKFFFKFFSKKLKQL